MLGQVRVNPAALAVVDLAGPNFVEQNHFCRYAYRSMIHSLLHAMIDVDGPTCGYLCKFQFKADHYASQLSHRLLMNMVLVMSFVAVPAIRIANDSGSSV